VQVNLRSFQDTVIDKNGKHLIEICRDRGLYVMNDQIGQNAAACNYTYIGSYGCSLINYMFGSQSLINMFDSFVNPQIIVRHFKTKLTFSLNNFCFMTLMSIIFMNKHTFCLFCIKTLPLRP
jgi:hypothetical protein